VDGIPRLGRGEGAGASRPFPFTRRLGSPLWAITYSRLRSKRQVASYGGMTINVRRLVYSPVVGSVYWTGIGLIRIVAAYHSV
jgi:hypothetical protein